MGITQGYSTLGSQWLMRGHSVNPVLESPVVGGIAAETGRDPAQVVLRWALQHGQVRARMHAAPQQLPRSFALTCYHAAPSNPASS